jgi:hypothetical protein
LPASTAPQPQSRVQESHVEPRLAQSASFAQDSVDKQMYAPTHPASPQAPVCASGFETYPAGSPVQTIVISVPSHAQPGE